MSLRWLQLLQKYCRDSCCQVFHMQTGRGPPRGRLGADIRCPVVRRTGLASSRFSTVGEGGPGARDVNEDYPRQRRAARKLAARFLTAQACLLLYWRRHCHRAGEIIRRSLLRKAEMLKGNRQINQVPVKLSYRPPPMSDALAFPADRRKRAEDRSKFRKFLYCR